jgi:hypothetical protein
MKLRIKSEKAETDQGEDETTAAQERQKVRKSKAKMAPSADDEIEAKAPPKRAKKAPSHQVLTARDEVPKLWDETKAAENSSYSKLLLPPIYRYAYMHTEVAAILSDFF